MATNYEELLQFVKSSERYPKVNKRQIQDPKAQIGSDEYNRIVSMLAILTPSGGTGGGVFKKYSMREYLDMVYNHQIENTFYTIYRDDKLYRVYLGEALIMKKKTEESEQVTMGGVFPLVFPIIFA